MYTMFESTFSGGWPIAARPLVEEVSVLWAFFWVIYASVVTFAVTRIIGAMFLKITLANAASDIDIAIEDEIKRESSYRHKLEDLIDEVSAGGEFGDGQISFAEFSILFEHPRAQAYFCMVGLQVRDVPLLWSLLDGGDGVLSRDEFINGVMRIKGYAVEQDVYVLLQQNRQISFLLAQLVNSPAEPPNECSSRKICAFESADVEL